MTETLIFDKGVSPTGVYITDPAAYSSYIEFAETLPVDLVKENYEWHEGFLVSKGGHDPYAFQSKREVDEHIQFMGSKVLELGEAFTTWREERAAKAYAEGEQLKLKYGVQVSMPSSEEE